MHLQILVVAALFAARQAGAEPVPTALAAPTSQSPDADGELQLAGPEVSLLTRLEELEQQNALLAAEQQELTARLDQATWEQAALSSQASTLSPGYRDRGAFVLMRGSEEQPFELRADFFVEARYTDFDRSSDSWTDSTGAALPVRDFDSIEITRNFIQFAGYALDPALQFTANIFSSTALNDTLYLGWINYRFSDAVDVRVGNWLAPGTREWQESFRYTLGVDRLMATTYFRPNISPGVWVQGEPWAGVYYIAMLANSLNRFTQGVERVGSSKAVSMTAWWEPTDDFGPGPSDIELHEALSLRLGGSMTFSEEANQAFGNPEFNNPEDTIIRLSDGTPLFRPHALGPGVQLSSARINLWALDAAMKYRGLSLSGEYFLRLLDDFDAGQNQPSRSSVFDHGGLLQGGAMLISNRLEAFARTSFVTGPFGSGDEYGGGLNWYPRGVRDWRFTGEVIQINNSPAQNLLTGYRAGASGTLLQLQWFVDF